MQIYTPMEAAREAGNKYLAVLVAGRFARYLNELPRDHTAEEKLTTTALDALCSGDLSYKLIRRRRTDA
jgi:DNA-directed RNA polymerase subunit K/omega